MSRQVKPPIQPNQALQAQGVPQQVPEQEAEGKEQQQPAPLQAQDIPPQQEPGQIQEVLGLPIRTSFKEIPAEERRLDSIARFINGYGKVGQKPVVTALCYNDEDLPEHGGNGVILLASNEDNPNAILYTSFLQEVANTNFEINDMEARFGAQIETLINKSISEELRKSKPLNNFQKYQEMLLEIEASINDNDKRNHLAKLAWDLTIGKKLGMAKKNSPINNKTTTDEAIQVIKQAIENKLHKLSEEVTKISDAQNNAQGIRDAAINDLAQELGIPNYPYLLNGKSHEQKIKILRSALNPQEQDAAANQDSELEAMRIKARKDIEKAVCSLANDSNNGFTSGIKEALGKGIRIVQNPDKLHAEVVILKELQTIDKSNFLKKSHYIGVSKLCCKDCAGAIKKVNADAKGTIVVDSDSNYMIPLNAHRVAEQPAEEKADDGAEPLKSGDQPLISIRGTHGVSYPNWVAGESLKKFGVQDSKIKERSTFNEEMADSSDSESEFRARNPDAERRDKEMQVKRIGRELVLKKRQEAEARAQQPSGSESDGEEGKNAPVKASKQVKKGGKSLDPW